MGDTATSSGTATVPAIPIATETKVQVGAAAMATEAAQTRVMVRSRRGRMQHRNHPRPMLLRSIREQTAMVARPMEVAGVTSDLVAVVAAVMERATVEGP